MAQFNKISRYFLSQDVAEKLGCTLNKNNRYRLSSEQESLLMQIDNRRSFKRLFLDIETTTMKVHSFQIGRKVSIGHENIIDDWKIICISYKYEGDERVTTLTWDENMCDKKMVEAVVKIIDNSAEVCGHNAKRFDLKKIAARAIYHRIPMQPHYRVYDTLSKARTHFAFSSNRLDYLGNFLGLGGKMKHSGFSMWLEVMGGSRKALKEMTLYCEQDVLLLEEVFTIMQNYVRCETHKGVSEGKSKYSCPSCGGEDVELDKTLVTAAGSIQRVMDCNSCGHTYKTNNSTYINFIEDKMREKRMLI